MNKTVLTALAAAGLVGACSSNPPTMSSAQTSAPVAKVVAPLAPVAQPPARVAERPAPVPQPIPRDVPFKVSMEAFFDFDKAQLRTDGEAKLDTLAQRLAVTNFQTLSIVGHADRIGGVEYNQALSERRAKALRDYLVSKGISGQKVVASGVGKDQPTANCPSLSGERLVQCLQPDRNAELTVSGTQQAMADRSAKGS